jgi:hypothetical protein
MAARLTEPYDVRLSNVVINISDRPRRRQHNVYETGRFEEIEYCDSGALLKA